MYNLQLQRLRKEAGYKTQANFARVLGISSRKYETWERGQVGLPLEDACQIADVLGCTLDELAGRDFIAEKWGDPRQKGINQAYSLLDEDGKDNISATVNALAGVYIKRNSKVPQLG